jgi:hypothetical protein
VTAGVGGFNDIITRARKIVFSGYFTAGKKDIQVEDGRLKIISEVRSPNSSLMWRRSPSPVTWPQAPPRSALCH